MLLLMSSAFSASAWSNGGYSADPSSPDYGTHDWIAQRALDWLPLDEKKYIVDNLASYLYGTELPDKILPPDGIGDYWMHHIYYRSSGGLQDDASATRASAEFNAAKTYLETLDYAAAAETTGIMSAYIDDMAVFGHVMGSSTDWGSEVHHSDYEEFVTDQTTGYHSIMFDPYLVFDGSLNNLSAYDAALQLAYNTTFGNGVSLKNCSWMDSNYDAGDNVFMHSVGASLNLAVNVLADVLHTLAMLANYTPPPDTTNPVVTITSPHDGAILDMTVVTVTGTASDDMAVQTVEISRNGTTWSPCTGTTSWICSINLGQGASKIYAKATDTSGNHGIANITVTIRLSGTGQNEANQDGVLGLLVAIIVLFALVLLIALAWMSWRKQRKAL